MRPFDQSGAKVRLRALRQCQLLGRVPLSTIGTTRQTMPPKPMAAEEARILTAVHRSWTSTSSWPWNLAGLGLQLQLRGHRQFVDLRAAPALAAILAQRLRRRLLNARRAALKLRPRR
jgi:hypothetical protein